MHYENPLDHIIQRFQHRWETDRQYRAAMSGVLGIVLILVLCSGVGVVDMISTQVLSAFGFQTGASANGSHQNDTTGAQIVNGGLVFYTPTVTWTSAGIPGATPLANSQTPAPSPTPTPTPTDVATRGPCQTNCGGGPKGNISASWLPAIWSSGQTGAAFTVHTTDTSGNPKSGVGIAIIYTWAGSATWLDENGATTNASGDYTSHPVVGNCPSSTHKFSAYVQAFFPGGKVENTWPIPCQ